MLTVTVMVLVVWGSTYLVTTEFLPPDRPLFTALARALPAGLLLVAISRQLPRGSWWWRAGVLGVLNIGVFFALLFIAAYRLPGGVAATVIALQPLVVVGLSVLLLHRRSTRRAVVAGLAGIAGVALLVLRADARLDAVGLAAAIGAAVCMAFGIVLSKRWPPPGSVVAFAGWQLTAGGLLLLPLALLVEGPPPPLDTTNIAGLAYLSLLGAALTYVLWFRGIRLLPATDVAFLGLVSPMVATFLGWVVLGQDLTVVQIIGAVMVLVSVVAGQSSDAPARGGTDGRLPRQARRQPSLPARTGSAPQIVGPS